MAIMGSEVVEYRVLYDARATGESKTWELPLSDETSLSEAESRLEKASHRPYGRFNFRIQRSVVTRTDWEDVEV